MQETKVLFTDKSSKGICFQKISEFIKWAYIHDDENIIIDSEIEEIKVEDLYNLLDFIRFYKQVKRECQKQNEHYNELLLEENIPEINEALEELVRLNKDGKYLRATLAALGYRNLKDDNEYKYLSAALEIFQTSILIHDDIIDEAMVRRGKSTIPVAYMNKYNTPLTLNKNFKDKQNNFAQSMALCIGDLGFYIANQIIVKNYKKNPHLSDLLIFYNDMVINTCKGEMLDIVMPFKEEYFETNLDLEKKIFDIYKLKTAWYSVIGPYCLGMILSGMAKEEVAQVQKCLLNIGMAFQIQDDLLGVYGDEKVIGKSTASDIAEYKQTILYSYTMNTKYKAELQKYYGQALEKNDLNKAKELFIQAGAKEYAEKTMDSLFESSIKEIDNLDFINNKNILKGFIIYLKNRDK